MMPHPHHLTELARQHSAELLAAASADRRARHAVRYRDDDQVTPHPAVVPQPVRPTPGARSGNVRTERVIRRTIVINRAAPRRQRPGATPTDQRTMPTRRTTTVVRNLTVRRLPT